MIITRISNYWQDWLPVLVPVCLALWLVSSYRDLGSTASLFALHLPIYMAHQIEEHYRPGGFRQFANAQVFHSGQDNFPASRGRIAFVNIVIVWLPIALAALFPAALFLVGTAMFAITFANFVVHVVTSLRLRVYNPGLVTAIVLLLPISLWFFVTRVSDGELNPAGAAFAIGSGFVLHVPIALIFIIPYRRARDISLRPQPPTRATP